MESSMREKKNITFSTRWTESMDNAINDLSDSMMISKQDLVRIAISEYLGAKNKVIQDYREYRNEIKFDLYEEYCLGKTGSAESGTEVDTIFGYISGESKDEEIIDFLVDIHISIPKRKNSSEINNILDQMKACKDEELRKKLIELINPQYEKEITLKYTSDGIKVKNDPKFKLCLEKSIEAISERIMIENNK